MPAELLDRRALLLVGADDVVDGDVGRRFEMIGAGAGAEPRAGEVLRRVDAAADQFERAWPVHAHAALRGIHRFGDAEAEAPQMAAERDGALPVDRGIEPGIGIGQRIGDHMRGRIGDAAERRRGGGNCFAGLVVYGAILPPAIGRLSVGIRKSLGLHPPLRGEGRSPQASGVG